MPDPAGSANELCDKTAACRKAEKETENTGHDPDRHGQLQFTELSGRCSVFERPLSDAKRPLIFN